MDALGNRIYDCFTFYDELDLLDIRLHELNTVVDVFVLVEATHDFKGREKPLTFLENAARFEPFLHKIRHVTARNMPIQSPTDAPEVWANEAHQRNCIALALDDCRPQDLIVVSDVDEIPRAGAVRSCTKDGTAWQMSLDCFHFNFNWTDLRKEHYIYDARAIAFSHFTTPCDLRIAPHVRRIRDAGWHCTWFGGAEKIAQKAGWYSHALPGLGSEGRVILTLNKPLTYVPGDAHVPAYVRENTSRFAAFFETAP